MGGIGHSLLAQVDVMLANVNELLAVKGDLFRRVSVV
jgi:hypothetical protein